MNPDNPIYLYRPSRRNIGLMAVTVAYAVTGFDLLLQPERWERTAAYGNLLNIISAQKWAVLYVAVAGLLAASLWLHQRWGLGVVAHTTGIALGVFWWAAFVIRWLTDDSTTVANVLSWGIYLLLLGLSSMSLARKVSR